MPLLLFKAKQRLDEKMSFIVEDIRSFGSLAIISKRLPSFPTALLFSFLGVG